MPAARLAGVEETPGLVETLADAFDGDPAMGHLIPAAHRRRLLAPFFRETVRAYRRIGEVWTAADGDGAALWAPPGAWPIAGREAVRGWLTLLRVFGRRPLRSLRAERSIVGGLPDEPYWYLDYIGVAPTSHGGGIGSTLLAAKLEQLDGAGAAAHLTASSPASRELYARHGFRTFGEFRLPDGGPPMWRMWRQPRPIA